MTGSTLGRGRIKSTGRMTSSSRGSGLLLTLALAIGMMLY